MKRDVFRIMGLVMILGAIIFLVFALNHPEMSFPWSNTVTWSIYGIYAVVTVILLIVSVKKR